MKIAVIGAGGVGGYFGARLAAAGHDVSFVQRGRHFLAMEKTGLHIESELGNTTIHAVSVTQNPSIIGPVDVVLVAVKSQESGEVAKLCKPMLGPNTCLITLQNGVENEEIFAKIVGHNRVLGGVAYILSLITSPGNIKHTGQMAKLEFGELDGSMSERAQSFLSVCQDASIDVELTNDITKSLWKKFIFLCPHNGMTALTRSSIGQVREDPECRSLLRAAANEVITLAKAKGMHTDLSDATKCMALYDKLPAEMTSSMHYDVTHGKPLELDWLNGAVVRLSHKHGLETPVNGFIYSALKLLRSGGGVQKS